MTLEQYKQYPIYLRLALCEVFRRCRLDSSQITSIEVNQEYDCWEIEFSQNGKRRVASVTVQHNA